MDLMQFIPQQLLILVAAIYILGIGLKKTEKIKDNFIPIILIVFSIVFSLILEGISGEAFLQGILCWGLAVGINQTGKQMKKGE